MTPSNTSSFTSHLIRSARLQRPASTTTNKGRLPSGRSEVMKWLHAFRHPASKGVANCFMHIQFALGIFLANAAVASGAELLEVASCPDKQITGVGVSTRSGRIFVNFPYWSDFGGRDCRRPAQSVSQRRMEHAWPAGSHFVCVQSVIVDDQDNLWVLDPAAPQMQEIVKGADQSW